MRKSFSPIIFLVSPPHQWSLAKRKYMLSHFSHVQLLATLWTVANQASLSMGFFRQEYWSGLPCPPLGDLPSPGIKPRSPTLQPYSLPSELPAGKSNNSDGYH